MTTQTAESNTLTLARNVAATVPMIVCPTTHNDWDWQMIFEDYYGNQGSSQADVRSILNSVAATFAGTGNNAYFCFSYAEVGFLRQYLEDPTVDPLSKLRTLKAAGRRFCLLGGGITSPDNLVCNSELFIRNYLTGHDFLRSVQLIDQVFPVGWIPDDFGHSPQLPVLFEAMGMKAAGLSRIPGSPQPTPCSAQLADQTVRAAGLSFNWTGRDGSNVLTHFMPQTYYGITNYSVTDTTSAMNDFLHDHAGDTWPGGVIFATQGGDWQFPASDNGAWTGGYTWSEVIGATPSGGGTTASARLGTFADYFACLEPGASQLLPTTLYAENYWTGHFASRPQLKIDQYYATRQLVGAEVLASILSMYGGSAQSNIDALIQSIAKGWHLLVPTSHHDFITGTSPDSVYDPAQSTEIRGAEPIWDSQGQLRMSGNAAALADEAMAQAMDQLAARVSVPSAEGEHALVVFNQLGRDLPDTAVVECPDPGEGRRNYQVRVDGALYPVQRSSEGTLLFQVPGMKSMSYRIVHLVPGGSAEPSVLPQSISGDDYQFGNGQVKLLLDQSHGWAISSLEIAGQQYVQTNSYANELEIWTDGGNIYQFGMEYVSSAGPCATGTFEASSTAMTGSPGSLLENGPIRWRAVGNISGGDQNYTTRYDLIAGETMVRIATTGAAPSGTSVLASFGLQNSTGQAGDMLEYGTCYHWENRKPQPSWPGLIFRASHDFATLASSASGAAVGGVYHNGIPAWTIDNTTLRGCLLRNTPGGNRGAQGSDAATHTQSYTLDVGAQVGTAATGYPLRTAVYAQTKLHARLLNNAIPEEGRIPERAQLASVAQADALVSVAKPGRSNEPSAGRSLVLRIQQATDETQQLDIDLPFLRHRSLDSVNIVSALETPALRAPSVAVNGTTLSFEAARALWTLLIESI